MRTLAVSDEQIRGLLVAWDTIALRSTNSAVGEMERVTMAEAVMDETMLGKTSRRPWPLTIVVVSVMTSAPRPGSNMSFAVLASDRTRGNTAPRVL